MPLLASEIQKIFENFKTLYQLRMCMMTSCDLNVSFRRKNLKLCLPIESLPTMPLTISSAVLNFNKGAQNRIYYSFLQSLEQNIKMNLQILSKVRVIKKNFQEFEIHMGLRFQKLLPSQSPPGPQLK